MIAIGNNKLKKRYITDSNGNEQEAKKVYIGTNLVHLHMQDSNNPFAYRITNDGKIGEAVSVKGEISNVKGNTVSWNQCINGVEEFTNTTTDTNPTLRMWCQWRMNNSIVGRFTPPNTLGRTIVMQTATSGINNLQIKHNGNSSDIIIATTYTNIVSGHVYIFTYIIVDNQANVVGGIVIRNMQLFDLTLIYGAGNEPTTPEQFEADYERWFGKPLTYEPYNAGELIPTKTTAVKTIGFNQFNPTTNIAKVIKGIEYQITGSYTSLTLNGETIVPDSNGKFTPSITGEVQIVGGDSSTTCVHLSGRKDSEYESYEEHTLQLPITTLTGKLNGEGESVIVFPDGMKKAGSVCDEIYISGGKTYAVKRVGSVDLGTMQEWSITTSGLFQLLYFAINYNAKPNPDSQSPSVLVMAEYKAVGASPISGADTEKEVALHRSGGILYINTVGQYSDVATFKAAMQGVMLYYELATPLIYELDDFELPENYIANGLSTEELLPANDTTLVTAPADMTIDYTLN